MVLRTRERASLCALSTVCGLCQQAKQGAQVGDELANALFQHGEAKMRAYGADAFTVKDHKLKHVPPQIKEDEELMDTLVTERYHKLSKAAMENLLNTRQFERSCLARVVASCLRTLDDPDAFTCTLLHGPVTEMQPGVFCSKEMRVNYQLIGVGDIIWMRGRPLLIEACNSFL